MKIVLDEQEIKISTNEEYSNLLLKMEDKGLDVSVGCTIGLCGVCKLKVIDGKENLIRITDDIFDLSDDEILPCCFKIKGDIVLKKEE